MWDALALLVVAFVAWKLLIAPRWLQSGSVQPAPRITLSSLSGPPFKLAAHRGHVVFLDFFASWCEPCKLSLPLVERFARSHPQVDVIPIDVGEAPAVAAEFAKAYHLHGVALDPQRIAYSWFSVEGFPPLVVIDARGNIRATWAGLNPAVQINMAHAAASLGAGG